MGRGIKLFKISINNLLYKGAKNGNFKRHVTSDRPPSFLTVILQTHTHTCVENDFINFNHQNDYFQVVFVV